MTQHCLLFNSISVGDISVVLWRVMWYWNNNFAFYHEYTTSALLVDALFKHLDHNSTNPFEKGWYGAVCTCLICTIHLAKFFKFSCLNLCAIIRYNGFLNSKLSYQIFKGLNGSCTGSSYSSLRILESTLNVSRLQPDTFYHPWGQQSWHITWFMDMWATARGEVMLKEGLICPGDILHSI